MRLCKNFKWSPCLRLLVLIKNINFVTLIICTSQRPWDSRCLAIFTLLVTHHLMTVLDPFNIISRNTTWLAINLKKFFWLITMRNSICVYSSVVWKVPNINLSSLRQTTDRSSRGAYEPPRYCLYVMITSCWYACKFNSYRNMEQLRT